MLKKVNLADKLALFREHWSPKIVGELNGQVPGRDGVARA